MSNRRLSPRDLDCTRQEATHEGAILAVRAMLEPDRASLAADLEITCQDIVTDCAGDQATVRLCLGAVLDRVSQVALQHPAHAQLAWLVDRLSARLADLAG